MKTSVHFLTSCFAVFVTLMVGPAVQASLPREGEVTCNVETFEYQGREIGERSIGVISKTCDLFLDVGFQMFGDCEIAVNSKLKIEATVMLNVIESISATINGVNITGTGDELFVKETGATKRHKVSCTTSVR